MAVQKHENLAAALAAFQAELPDIAKNARGQSRGGQTKYADLAEVSSKVMPVLGKHGLSFSSRPTLTDDGRFVLAYTLRHESGQGVDCGSYPLPDKLGPQETGSAITYARRYVLMAITGVAPDEDDDGHTAQQSHNGAQQRRAQPSTAQPSNVASDSAPSPGAAQGALRFVRQKAEREGISWDQVRLEYANRYEGEVIEDATDQNRLTAFAKLLKPVEAPAGNGVKA